MSSSFDQTALAHLIALRMKVASGALKTVVFEELFYLFSPSDLILSASISEKQLSQVCSVSGGRMRLVMKTAQHHYMPHPSKKKEDNANAGFGTWTALSIHVKYFTGEKPITHLDAYPVRFHHNSAKICQSDRRFGLEAFYLWISVDGIEEIDETEQARQIGWNDLVTPEEYRRLLVSLVDNHTSGVKQNKRQKVDPKSNLRVQIDLVRGKGRALIILLDGPPDLSKTSTAETITL
ncbi:hypothetical protein CORC01_00017 [Colletotrichum orchidophilum]|uniref:DUF7025 domain-containing protein n=1 Tax=Colletotrichum orchidophilum TaxID=1209926 RepID=A0A1G4BT96_9PEZI|nr:uncharacterized protein CORC01_00017 [Colletotrichum orchidophilum]OHF04546.1 hypothetical protein CORC01_00017 [Colletotrichum orchidophilum]